MVPESAKLRKSTLCGIAALVVITACVDVRYLAGQGGASFAFISADDGKVYAQVGPGRLEAVDGQTASVLWDFRSENLSVFTTAAFRPDALFVVGVGSDSNSELIRLNLASGKAHWRAPIPRPEGDSSPVLCGEEVLVPDTLPISSVPVAVASDLVFLSHGSRIVEARELPSGKPRWRVKLKGRINSNIVVTDRRV
jgi:outer membrane protein assembly factor BamB